MPRPRLEIVRRGSFKAVPWRNGGGITHEALRLPQGDAPFRCRVSVAQIEASGPFSDFAGYERKMVLLEGDGMELRFGDLRSRTLRSVGELAEFDGGMATQGILLGGPCVDLNLMVSKQDRAEARVERLMDTHVRVGAGQILLVFPIDGRVSLDLDGGEGGVLEPWDLAVVAEGGARIRSREPNAISPGGAGRTAAAVFLATLELVG